MGILFNFSLDTCYKQNRFSKILLEKGLKFILSRENSTIAFNLSLILLVVEIYLVIKKQDCKKNIFKIYAIGYIKIVFTLQVKVEIFYI